VAADVYDDAAPCVAAIRQLGLTVGALTNGNCDVTRAGESVASLFDVAVRADEAGAAKPSVAPFLRVAAACGCHPSEVVHVGDSIEADLRGALGCGMRAILLTRDGFVRSGSDARAERPPADDARWREVATLEQAASVVREWAAAADAE